MQRQITPSTLLICARVGETNIPELDLETTKPTCVRSVRSMKVSKKFTVLKWGRVESKYVVNTASWGLYMSNINLVHSKGTDNGPSHLLLVGSELVGY
jgi:hypothetical protein